MADGSAPTPRTVSPLHDPQLFSLQDDLTPEAVVQAVPVQDCQGVVDSCADSPSAPLPAEAPLLETSDDDIDGIALDAFFAKFAEASPPALEFDPYYSIPNSPPPTLSTSSPPIGVKAERLSPKPIMPPPASPKSSIPNVNTSTMPLRSVPKMASAPPIRPPARLPSTDPREVIRRVLHGDKAALQTTTPAMTTAVADAHRAAAPAIANDVPMAVAAPDEAGAVEGDDDDDGGFAEDDPRWRYTAAGRKAYAKFMRAATSTRRPPPGEVCRGPKSRSITQHLSHNLVSLLHAWAPVNSLKLELLDGLHEMFVLAGDRSPCGH